MIEEDVRQWEIEPRYLPDVGVSVLTHMLQARRWVHRRVESVRFEGESTVIREVTLDFTVPPRVEVGGTPAPASYVPLSLFKKHKLRLFHLADGSHTEIPLLTRRARNQVASKGLEFYAREVLARPEYVAQPRQKWEVTQLVRLIGELPTMKGPEASEAVQDLLSGDRPRSPALVKLQRSCDVSALDEYRERLRADRLFPLIAQNLATQFLVVCPIVCPAGTRSRVTFSYVEPLGLPGERGLTLLLRRASIAPLRVSFSAAAAADAGSFHFEVTAPEGLQITRSQFWRTRDRSRRLLPQYVPRRAGTTNAAESTGQLADQEAGSLMTSHLYARGTEPDSYGDMWINLRPRSSTLLPPAWLTSLVVVVVLTVASFGGLSGDRFPSAAALLLVAPGALAIYVVRPSESPATTYVLFGVRAFVTLSGLLAFAGAVVLAVNEGGAISTGLLVTFTVVALFCFLVLSLALLSTFRGFRTFVAPVVPHAKLWLRGVSIDRR